MTGVGAFRTHAVKAAVAVAAVGAVVGLAVTSNGATTGQSTAGHDLPLYQSPPSMPDDPASGNGCISASDHDRAVVQSALGRGRVLFIGASYSIGLGATKPADNFTNRLAGLLHVPFRVDAVSGTGFRNPGPHDQGTFMERLSKDPVNPAPRLVLIQGGRDDAKDFNRAKEYSAAVDTIKLAQQRFSHAQVVLLGPIPALLPVPPVILQARDAIAAAARTTHAGFIDPIAEHWITPANEHQYTGRVKGHPNNAGYAYITTRLLAELPTALNEAQPPLQRPARDGNQPQPTSTATPDANQPVCGREARPGDGQTQPGPTTSPAPVTQASLPADT